MHKGGIVEIGTRDEVLDHPRHAYTRALLAASPRIEPAWQDSVADNREPDLLLAR